MQPLRNLIDPEIVARFLRRASQLQRDHGQSKHAAGRQRGRDHRLNLKRRRKRQRQARRYARACSSGRKHRMGRPQ